MVVNTEWGAFGDNGELDYVKTKWDEEVNFLFEALFEIWTQGGRFFSQPGEADIWKDDQWHVHGRAGELNKQTNKQSISSYLYTQVCIVDLF